MYFISKSIESCSLFLRERFLDERFLDERFLDFHPNHNLAASLIYHLKSLLSLDILPLSICACIS